MTTPPGSADPSIAPLPPTAQEINAAPAVVPVRRLPLLMRWTRRRIKKSSSSPVVLRQNKTFIFFTPLGFVQWIMWLFLLLLSLNYANNVAMISVCILLVLNFIGIFQNYLLVRRLAVFSWTHEPHPEHAAGSVRAQVVLVPFGYRVNPDSSQVDGFSLRPVWWRRWVNRVGRRFLRDRLVFVPSTTWPLCTWTVDGQNIPLIFRPASNGVGYATARWTYPARAAGVYTHPVWTISSTWPAGVPRSWSVFRPAGVLSIIPDTNAPPAGFGAAPTPELAATDVVMASSGLPDGVRALSDREPRVRLAWRATLRHRVPMVATWEDSGEPVFLIAWPEDNRPPRNQAAEVYSVAREAVVRGRRFRLVHPQVSLSAGVGEQHALESVAAIWEILEPAHDWDTRWSFSSPVSPAHSVPPAVGGAP